MTTSVDSTEAVQLRAAAAGDGDAWERLVDAHVELVWGVARRYALSESEAAEVSATTWLRLAESLDGLDAPAGVRAWLADTARRECLRHLARTGRLAAPTGPASEPQSVLAASMSQLSPRCHELLRLLMLDAGPTYEQIAAAMKIPVTDVEPDREECVRRLARLVRFGHADGDDAAAERRPPP